MMVMNSTVQQKLEFGIGNLNHGFKHISSIFMLMSLNYLPIIAPRAIESNMLLENVSRGVSNESYRKAHILSGKLTLAFSTLESTNRVFENNTDEDGQLQLFKGSNEKVRLRADDDSFLNIPNFLKILGRST